MPLFNSKRDASFLYKVVNELVSDIVDTRVAVYKLSLSDTKTNIYDESDKKIYFTPVIVPALINRMERTFEGTEFGQDYTQTCDFAFIREQLKEYDVLVEVGDIIEFNGEWWEVDSIQDNQYFGGKNPDYATSENRWGLSVSIVANCHLTRRSHIHIEEIRSAPRTDLNDLPSNI
jgi:hypothetical protein